MARFEQDPQASSQDGVLGLLVCAEFASALRLSEAMDAAGQTLAPHVQARLDIELGRPPALLAGEAKTKRWLAYYAAKGVDMAYPANLVSLTVSPEARRCVFVDHCPACGEKRPLDPQSDFIRDQRYFCPACLASRTLDRTAVRTAAAKIYLEFFNSLPCDSEGQPTEDSMRQALAVATLLKPVLHIRFGYVYSERIGHLSLNTAIYLNSKKLNDAFCDTLDIIGNDSCVANEQLAAMLARSMEAFSHKATRVAKFLPSGSPHFVRETYCQYPHDKRLSGRDIDGLFETSEPLLRFTDQERQRGLEELEAMGVPPNAPFVCLHVRDSGYLKQINPDLDVSYHDFRDADVDTYAQAALALARRGVHVIRLGAVVNKPFLVDSPFVIDYATHHRSDFMDIWLSAHCLFFIGTGSGVDGVASIFKRPVLFTNQIPLTYVSSWSHSDLILPKKMYSTSLRRFLSLCEIVRSGVGEYLYAEKFAADSIEVVNNTAEEIEQAVLEMLARVQGTWEDDPGDAQRQKRFWRLFSRNPLHGPLRAMISAAFLREYPFGV